MKKKTLTGAVGLIRVIMVVRCGGAAVSQAETCRGASLASTKARKMKTMIRQRTRRMKRIRRRSTCAVLAAKKLVTLLMNVHGTLTSKQD